MVRLVRVVNPGCPPHRTPSARLTPPALLQQLETLTERILLPQRRGRPRKATGEEEATQT